MSSLFRGLDTFFSRVLRSRGKNHGCRGLRNCWIKRTTTTMTISKKPTGRGAFIVLEGLDRSGKTTQSCLLVEELRKLDVPTEFIRFPDRNSTNPLSKMISDYLSSSSELDPMTAHLLFTAQRAQERSRMKQLLESGTTLVVDRYSYSGIVYSMAKGLDRQWCINVESLLLKPDLVVYMDISPDVAKRRAEFGQERYENPLFQEKVHRAYELVREHSWKVVSATDSKTQISSQILQAVLETLDVCQKIPLASQKFSLAPPPSIALRRAFSAINGPQQQ